MLRVAILMGGGTSSLRNNSVDTQNVVEIFSMAPTPQLSQDAQKAGLLTRPTPAASSHSRPEPAKTGLLPKDAPFRRQGRSERRGEEVRTALRGAVHSSSASDFRTTLVEPLRDARTPLVDFFSILLEDYSARQW